MPDVVDTLVDILCQQGTVSNCNQFIGAYGDIPQQLLWLVFFPSVFLIIFVILIANGVASSLDKGVGKKYSALLGIALYLFIIVQGWYHYFLNISKYWFIGIIILGGVLVLTKKMGAGHSGGGGRGGGGLARSKDSVKGKLYRSLISGEKKDMVHHIETELKNLENIKRAIENPKSGGDITRLRETFTLTLERVENHLNELRKEEAVGGIVVLGKKYKQMENRLHSLTHEIDKQLEKRGH